MPSILSRSLLLALLGAATAAQAQRTAPSAEAAAIAPRAGTWDVTETLWPEPGAAPTTTTGLVAERRMVGDFLEERLVAADGDRRETDRIDYVGYNRTAGQWDYVSIDVRAPVPIMPAWSLERGRPERITVDFAPFARPASGTVPEGQMVRMQEIIAQDGPDHDTKDQFFIMADGTGRKWLAHRYDYRRRR